MLIFVLSKGYKAPTRRTVQRQLKRLHSKHSSLLLNELKTINERRTVKGVSDSLNGNLTTNIFVQISESTKVFHHF